MSADPFSFLLVEDNEEDARIVERLLRQSAHLSGSVARAKTLTAALEMGKADNFDAVLLDLGLPDAQGLETVRRILAAGSKAAIIVLTVSGDLNMGMQAVALGVDDFIPKDGLTIEVLERAIRYGLERRKTVHLEVDYRELERALRERDILLKETHHRVKNNMQIISSLLKLQAAHVSDCEARERFRQCVERVSAMALVHERIYKSKHLAEIEMVQFVQELLERLKRSYYVEAANVSVETEMAPKLLELDQAIPFGLILNELISNAFKHAFVGDRAGILRVTITSDNGNLVLCIADNGHGLPPEIDVKLSPSLGFEIVRSLTEQLHGTLDVKRGEGTEFVLKIPLKT